MPAPLGQEPLEESLLLRMTTAEKAYVAKLAKRYKMSMNTVLRDLITTDMARDRLQDHLDAKKAREAAEAPQPPPRADPPQPAPRPAKKTTRPRRPPITLSWSDVADPPIKGQTSITDPDQ